MAKLEALIKDADRFYASVYNGVKRSAEKVVDELQQAGPSWTGKFSNSWEIREGQKTVSGGGVQGEPKQLTFPPLAVTNTRLFKSTDSIVFSIFNTSSYRDLALDKKEGTFRRPTALPQTELGQRKFFEVNQGRVNPSKRWEVGGGSLKSSSSRTANQDWYSDYISSGKIQRILKNELDSSVRRLA